jgi:hypothetical protein
MGLREDIVFSCEGRFSQADVAAPGMWAIRSNNDLSEFPPPSNVTSLCVGHTKTSKQALPVVLRNLT